MPEMNAILIRLAALAAVLASGVFLPPAPAFGAEDDPVLATLNGREIRRSDAIRAKSRLPAELRGLPADSLLPILVNIVIDSRVLADEARKKGLAYKPEVRAQMAFVEDMVLEQAALNAYLQDKITEEMVKKRYQEMVADTGSRQQVRASHILVPDEKTAKEVIKRLDGGEDFAELAKKASVGPSAKGGGDLGYFSRKEMIPDFSAVAFALKVGEYTKEPVKTKYGWHVIKVTDRRTVPPPPFDKVKDELRNRLALELRTAYVEELRKGANISVNKEALTRSRPAPEGGEESGDGGKDKGKD